MIVLQGKTRVNQTKAIIYSESDEETRFANARVSEENKLKQVVAE